jgi:hypothetical protein
VTRGRAGARPGTRLSGLALLGAALAMPTPVQAQGEAHTQPGSASDFRVQLSAGAGLSRLDTGCAGAGCDRSDTAARAALAVTVVRGLALEALVLDFGRAREPRGTGTLQQRVRATGLGLMAPLELGPRLGAELRVGIARVQVRRSALPAGAVPAPGAGDGSSPEFYGGLGLTLALTPQLWLQVGRDTTQAPLADGTRRVGATTAGLALRF